MRILDRVRDAYRQLCVWQFAKLTKELRHDLMAHYEERARYRAGQIKRTPKQVAEMERGIAKLERMAENCGIALPDAPLAEALVAQSRHELRTEQREAEGQALKADIARLETSLSRKRQPGDGQTGG